MNITGSRIYIALEYHDDSIENMVESIKKQDEDMIEHLNNKTRSSDRFENTVEKIR